MPQITLIYSVLECNRITFYIFAILHFTFSLLYILHFTVYSCHIISIFYIFFLMILNTLHPTEKTLITNQ